MHSRRAQETNLYARFHSFAEAETLYIQHLTLCFCCCQALKAGVQCVALLLCCLMCSWVSGYERFGPSIKTRLDVLCSLPCVELLCVCIWRDLYALCQQVWHDAC